MDMTIDQQVAMDEAFVPHARRLRIGRSNFRLLSDIYSKESTLQLVYDVLRLTPFFKAFLGLYHKRNVDFAYLMWEDFVYQVKHKDTKKSKEMYYPRDDHMFTMIKLVSRHQNTQQFDAMLPIELTNANIRNTDAYKEYYAVATGATPPKTKAGVRKTKSSSDTTVTPPPTAAAGPRLSTSKKGKQPAKATKSKSLTTLSEVAMTEAQQLKLATKRSLQQTHISQASGFSVDEGTGTIPGVLDVPTEESNEEISWRSSDEGDDDDDEEGDDGSDDEQASDEEEFIHPSLSTHDEEETRDEESFDPIPKTPIHTNDEGNGEENLGMNVGREEGQDEEKEEDELYRDININLTLKANFSEFMQTNQFARAVSSITGIVQRYMDQQINEEVKVAVQIHSDRLRDEAQAENDKFLKIIDENMQKIIKEQVKEQVNVHVFKILPKIEQTMNEQLEAEVLTRSSNSSKTSYVVAANLSEMELKRILIEKIEVTLKRRQDDDVDKDKEPSLDQTRGPRDEEKTIDMTIDQQVAMDEALVPHARRLRIERSNFRLLSDISSKESTLQLVYDILCLTPFFKAFLVTADVLEIYLQEFWATATVHHHSIRFKMDNKKHIVNLESFREMSHICPRLPGQSFIEPPFEEEILAFLRFLGHSGAIRRLTDVEHKDTKKSNEMYYPRFTKVIINHFMSKDPSIPRRNKTKASVRKMKSSSNTTVAHPLTAAAGPRLTTSANGKQPATTSKAKKLSALSEVAMTEAQQLKQATKRSLQQTRISQASSSGVDEGTGTIPGVPDVPTDESEEEISWKSTDDEEFIHPSLSTHDEKETRDEESFDPILKTPENKNDEGNGKENLGMNVGREEGKDEEDEEDELYRDVNINLGRGVSMADVHTTQEFKDSRVTLTPVNPDENGKFLKTIDENMQKIIKEQVKEQVKIELKTILIKKIEGNKSIHRSNEQRNLYKALVEAYESDKIILDIYRDTVTLKRHRDDDAGKDEEPFAGSDRGSKRRKEGKEPESTKGPMQTTFEMEEPSHPEFETCANDQPIVEPSQHPEWFSQQKKPPTPDCDWNKTLPATHGSIQLWISELAKQSDSRSSFNELMDTPVDFSAFLINRLKVDTLTPELLDGPTYELMKGSCKSLVELEFFFEEVYKAMIDQLDWVNPEGQQYPHNLLKPLPLIPNSRAHHVIPFDHFINNNLEYLRGGTSSRKYTTSVTKTKVADYGHIKWIEDLVPRTMWIQEPVSYDKHALSGISHWGRKRQQFYRFAINRVSARDVYLKRRIIVVTELKIVEWHNYKHLDWITVHRDYNKLYKFKEGDFKRLRIQDIEDMLPLLI
nr:hypothetical protein [Tanacetum cinerariifolium]